MIADDTLRRQVRRSLLAFYDRHRRELPWRGADPYAVWVSEVMLQQTRVEAVIPYYNRWLERFPTLDALAEADVDDILKAWEGLGYYSRARNLHRAARLVRERHRGTLPADPATLRRLPGIGEYTAGAVASIAFGVAAPAIDGNARRVLARLMDLPTPSTGELRRYAAELVDPDRPGEFNQALMELGATICTPRTPACNGCPLTDLCVARARGTCEQRPLPLRRNPVPEADIATAVLRDAEGRLLVVRRAEEALLGGLWEFPGEGIRPGEEPAGAAARAIRALSRPAGVAAGPHLHPAQRRAKREPLQEQSPDPLAVLRHAFSHLRVRYHVFRFPAPVAAHAIDLPEPDHWNHGWEEPTPGTAAPEATLWVSHAELEALPLPAAQRRIARMLL